MNCIEARPLLSSYLDGAVTGSDMHACADHLQQCASCRSEYQSLEETKSVLASLGQKQAPPDLAVKIRVAIAQERTRNWQRRLQVYAVQMENSLNAFMLPATAGIVTAVAFVALLIGFFVPPAVNASDDVPSSFYTPPRLSPSAYGNFNLDASIVLETQIDATGRVENYRILAGPDDARMREQIDRALLFTIFQPAQTFGNPVPGKLVIAIARVNVQG
ncbi:MAG TPA: zf-HC2 domain-containing protein [Alphaproteobacteria bacterium]|nr:zf-HC2 domain-containing protein [Alphaproteobacteria bacterium]